MGKYPYTLKISSLESLLKEIQSMGVPEKINTKTLPTMGYKAKNDRALPPILKFIDFIDSKGVPTNTYKDFRNKQISKSVMGKAIKNAYADLYRSYPNAHERDDINLRDFFSGTTDAGEMVLRMTVETFKILCKFADFKDVPAKDAGKEITKEIVEKAGTTIPQMPTGVTVNVNIQLALPVTEDATVYDKIFKALKDNILSRD